MLKLIESIVSVPFALREKETKIVGLKDKEEVLTQFEAFFIHLILKEVRKSLSLCERSFEKDAFLDMILGKVSEFVAKRGLGLKEEILKYIKENL